MTATEYEYDLAIIGGGISGLSAAFEAKNKGLKFILLESSPRLGGCIHSSQLEGDFVVERGPNSFSMGDTLAAILQKLELEPVPAKAEAKNKFIYKDNRLNLVSPSEILFSERLLSLKSRLGLLKEAFRPFQTSPEGDCSVQDFVVKHFGQEVADNLVWPVLTGIYAGNPSFLSAKSVLTTLWNIEEKHGSLVRGLLKARLKFPKRQIFSFEGGLEVLPLKIQNYLGVQNYRLNAKVTAVASLTDGGYALTLEGQSAPFKTKKLISAAPAFVSAKLFPGLQKLAGIVYAPVLTVSLWLTKDQLQSDLQKLSETSFGFLKARSQESKLLGLVFNSALFSGRAPQGTLACTAFLGGFNDPATVSFSDREIAETMQAELMKVFGVKGELKMLSRWRQGIPQYAIGHSGLIAEVKSKLAPDLKLAGNYLQGVSIEEAAKSGKMAFNELFN